MGNQVHVGGDSNQRVLQQVRLEFPGEMLMLQTTALIARITDAADPMLPESVLVRLKRVSEDLGGHCQRYHQECRRAAEYLRATQTTDIVRPQDGAPLDAVVSGRCGLKVATLVCDRCFLCLPDLMALKAHMRQQHDHCIPHMTGPFLRHRHGKDGMPTCLHCDRRFPSWSHLERHIREHNCEPRWLQRQEAGLSPEQPDESAPSMGPDQVHADDTLLPMVQRVQVRTVCANDGWQSLLDVESLRAEMVNHCVLCHQWVDQKQIKIHVRRIHADEWKRLQATVTQECRQLARVAVSPCRWCGAVVKRFAEHPPQCSVVWQACLLGHLVAHGSDGCGGRDVDDVGARPSFPAPVPAGPDGGRTTDAGRRNQAEATKPRGKADGQRRRQGSQSTEGRRLGKHTKPLDAQSAEQSGTPGDGDQAASQARGLPQSVADGHGLHLHFQKSAQRSRLPSPNSLSGIAGLAQQVSSRPLQTGAIAESDNLALPTDRAPAASSEICGRGRSGGSEGYPACWVDDIRREVGISSLEPCREQAADGRDPGNHVHTGGDRPATGHAEPARSARDLVEVCGNTTTRSGDERTSDLLHLRSVVETLGCGSAVCTNGEADGTCNAAPGWLTDQTIEGTDFRACHPHTRKALQSVLCLIFRNSRNACYMNSFCAATLWTVILESGERDFHMGRLNAAFHALLKQPKNRVSVPGLVPWRLALMHWPQPQHQHDVVEFASYILGQAGAVSFDGAWEARVVDPVCRSADGGSLHNPISLELVASGSLQHAISGWHQQVYPTHRQAYPHALSRPPRILCLRLNRFCERDGGVRKDQSPIMLRPRLCVMMPLFADSQTVHVVPIRYTLTAGIYHLGETPDAGHYRAFVSGFTERNKKKFHVFDDNVQTIVATDGDVHTLCRNCYLLYFVQLTPQS